ncbi:hypothetical protein G7Y89_g2086 [Cudoniella acicularis]|uniref:Uncharacterized protein n=1 Tax=Cudoniella acicularis TaxID=354080 RepID=A0A8H4W7A5_9HELO|nr:hypothetical protein G7Y89_g2086 [Cudoniella acicularis]
MMKSTILRRVLLTPAPLRSSLVNFPPRTFHPTLLRQYATIPSIAQHSFWLSLVPKPLRRSPSASSKKKTKSREWNPATFFIIIFLFIGSMSIQMIALRNEFAAFSRRADAKIGLLKEIIERIKNGEEVDVEGLLGTGDPQREKEWEDVLQEIEQEDAAWEKSRRERSQQKNKVENPVQPSSQSTEKPGSPDESETKPSKSKAPIGFY